MTIKVYPYRQGSQSAGKLAQALGCRVLRVEGSKYSPRSGDTIINWGASGCPFENMGPARVLNPKERINIAANKLASFRLLQAAEVQIPRFASSAADVTWDGLTVVRHKLTGHSGEGIELVEEGQSLPVAPLYVEYIRKQDEYRVHVIGTNIAAVQRKARRTDTPDSEVNWQVRNHSNGFVFIREGVVAPEVVTKSAVDALVALGLDFGAVDVVYNKASGKAYVLEVNTAPGLEGQTITDYAEGFKALLSP